MAFTEDMDGEEDVKHTLEAMAACTKDDIVHWNWSIELVNSQVNVITSFQNIKSLREINMKYVNVVIQLNSI